MRTTFVATSPRMMLSNITPLTKKEMKLDNGPNPQVYVNRDIEKVGKEVIFCQFGRKHASGKINRLNSTKRH